MLMYEIFDSASGETIGRVTGDQLRAYFKLSQHSMAFNQTLIEKINADKERLGEPERIRTVLETTSRT